MGTPMGIDGTESSLSFMGNAIFNLDTGTRLTPFVGAGMGFAVLEVDAQPDGGGRFEDTDTQLAYQAMAGISVQTLHICTLHSSMSISQRHRQHSQPIQ